MDKFNWDEETVKVRYVPNSPLEPIIEVVNNMKLAEAVNQKLFEQEISGKEYITVPEKCTIEYKRPLIDKNLLP